MVGSEIGWIPSSEWPHDNHRSQVDNGDMNPAKKSRFAQQGSLKLQSNKANYFHIISMILGLLCLHIISKLCVFLLCRWQL